MFHWPLYLGLPICEMEAFFIRLFIAVTQAWENNGPIGKIYLGPSVLDSCIWAGCEAELHNREHVPGRNWVLRNERDGRRRGMRGMGREGERERL